MLKILWKRGKIAPEEQFLLLSTIFYYLMQDFYVKPGIRFSVRDKRLFEITEVEITRVDCITIYVFFLQNKIVRKQENVLFHQDNILIYQGYTKIPQKVFYSPSDIRKMNLNTYCIKRTKYFLVAESGK